MSEGAGKDAIRGRLIHLYGVIQNAGANFRYDRSARLKAVKDEYKELSRVMALKYGEPVKEHELKAAGNKSAFCGGCEREFAAWQLAQPLDIWGDPVGTDLKFCATCRDDFKQQQAGRFTNKNWPG